MKIKSTILLVFLVLTGFTVLAQGINIVKSTDVQEKNNKQYFVHTVEKGQTLYSIAKTYNVSIDEIYYENPGAKYGLQIGQQLWIPTINKETEVNREVSTANFDFFYHIAKENERFKGIASVYDIPEKYINWMRNLEYYKVLDKFVVVHAGLNFNRKDPFEDKRAMIWARDYKIEPEKIDYRRVVHGHLPVNLEFIDMVVNNHESYWFIDIDNGVYFTRKAGYGNLLALNLETMEYAIQSVMDEVTYKGV